MKLILAAIALLLPIAALAQPATYQCQLPNGVACEPHTQGCGCTQVIQEPTQVQPAPPVVIEAPPVIVQQPQQCPYGTYWNGGVCIQLSQPPIYVPNPYHPYWGGGVIGGGHPGVVVGPGGHVFAR
jgi:hypothetical protein